MKPGFKQTEVGVIPEDWEVARLRDIAAIDEDNLSSSTPLNYSFNYIALEDIDRGILRGFSEEVFGSAPSRARRIIRSQDILVSTVRPNLKSHLLFTRKQGCWICSTGFSVVRCKKGAAVPTLIFQHFFAEIIARQIDTLLTGSNYPAINRNDVGGLFIPLPPTTAEQEAIAEALGDADALIESLERLVAKKRDVKQGAMQELLTARRRLPGFNGKWETKRLGEIGVFLKGSGVKKDEAQDGTLPCIRYGEIYTTHEYIVRTFCSWISHSVALTATRLQSGDILFAGSGETKEEIGKCAAFVGSEEAYAGGDIVILRPFNSDSCFLGYYLNSVPINKQKASMGQGDAIVHIGTQSLASIAVVLPSPTEQTAIATVLSDMDAELAALEAKLSKARAIKQGMMQELLTGRIRLK